MSTDPKARFFDPDLWIRFVYMVVFALLSAVSRFAVCLIALLQFLFVLFSGEDNRNLRSFGNSLSLWTLGAYRFLTFNSEEKPFPFMDWPDAERSDEKSSEVGSPVQTVVAAPAATVETSEDSTANGNQTPKV